MQLHLLTSPIMRKKKADKPKIDKQDPAKNPLYHKALDSNWRRLLLIFGVLVLLAGAGASVYWFFLRNKSDTAKPSEASQQNTAQPASKIATTSKHFVSQNFRLELDYPTDWTAPADNNQTLTFLSPDIQLKSSDGQTVNGQILLTIQAKNLKLPGLDGGNALAARDSKKIDYLRPSQVQRASTYISFLRYASSASGLDGVYITGDNGYQKDQAIPKVDIEKVDPIIYISFSKCPKKGCIEVGAALSIQAEMWDDPNFSGPLENMLKSLVIN